MAYRGQGGPYGRGGYEGHPMQDLNAQNQVSFRSVKSENELLV